MDSLEANDGIITASENVNNENLEKEMSDSTNLSSDIDQSYYENVTYNKAGVAVYTDPKTKIKYKFLSKENQWVELIEEEEEDDDDEEETDKVKLGNPYENEHYFWSHEQNKWLLKANYNWDETSKKWTPKEDVAAHEGEYGLENDVRTYTDKDGASYFWDNEKKAWFPKIDDEFMAYYQLNYGNYKEENETETHQKKEKNRIKESTDNEMPPQKKAKKIPEDPKWFQIDDRHNTKVYVENLPKDITDEEFVEIMSKYGMIFKDPSTHKFKTKLYCDDEGKLKGDGLCTYIKVESVHLAIDLLDGYDLRGNKLKVQRAKFEMRGDYNPALKPKKKKKEKLKIKKLQEKLLDWRPDRLRGERSRHERIVVIKNLFEPALFNARLDLILEYQNDLRDECSKCGTVRKVIIYDRHAEGVAQIVMGDPEEADIVVQLLNGRFFCQRKLEAYLWDGKEKFKSSETDAEMEARLSQWDKYLEIGEESTQDDNDDKSKSGVSVNSSGKDD